LSRRGNTFGLEAAALHSLVAERHAARKQGEAGNRTKSFSPPGSKISPAAAQLLYIRAGYTKTTPPVSLTAAYNQLELCR
jgi:hypothetical protein